MDEGQEVSFGTIVVDEIVFPIVGFGLAAGAFRAMGARRGPLGPIEQGALYSVFGPDGLLVWTGVSPGPIPQVDESITVTIDFKCEVPDHIAPQNRRAIEARRAALGDPRGGGLR